MNYKSLIERWKKENLNQCLAPSSSLTKFNFSEKNKIFLFEIGLPSDFICLLDFSELNNGELGTVNKSWLLGKLGLEKYVKIGYCEADPVVINIKNQTLVALNNDAHFEEIFINSSLENFALTSLKVLSFKNEFSLLNSKSNTATEFYDEEYDKVIHYIQQIDPDIFSKKNSLWKANLEYWLWEREEERKKAN